MRLLDLLVAEQHMHFRPAPGTDRIRPVQIRLTLSAILALAVPMAAQFPAYRPARMADGHPDLNGVWQALITADFDLQDHEAKPGPHPEVMGAVRVVLRGIAGY